ncbi:hypothetical protein ACFVHB_30775 [Kitasatospora sp. NPDC127111]|uniref:hypothetical protein n=1 Tax=Kitasatospora sp. NPDC127111 TaxID=3345363 RepID=UPI0036304B03
MHTTRFSVVAKLAALLFALAIPGAALAAGSGHQAAAPVVTAAASAASDANADDDLGWG